MRPSFFLIVFTVLGSIIGAGFVSGAELVQFFPDRGFLPAVYTSSVLLFALLGYFLRQGEKYGGFEGMQRACLGRYQPVASAVFTASSVLMASTMLAGLNEVGRAVLSHRLPILSALAAAGCAAVCNRGVGGIGKINAVLVPALVVCLVCLACRRQGEGFSTEGNRGALSLLLAISYAGMNVFLTVPLLCDLGAHLKNGRMRAAFLTAATVGGCVLLVLSAIHRGGEAALQSPMPLLTALGGNQALFAPLVAVAIFTSLVANVYPVWQSQKNRRNAAFWRFFILISAFAGSFLGLGAFVSVVYPMLGGLGIFYTVAVFVGEKIRKNPRISSKK